MKVSVLSRREEFFSIRQEWHELYVNSRSRNPFLHHSWILSAIDFLLTSELIQIVIIRTNDKKLIGACPLVVKNKLVLGKEIKILRHFNCYAADYSDLLVCSSVGNRDIVKKISEATLKLNFDLFQIDNLNSASLNSKLFMKFLSEKGVVSNRYVNVVNPILDYCDIEHSDKKAVKDIERRLNKLRKENEVEFFIDQDIDEDSWLKLVNFHEQNYPGVGFNSDVYQNFYKDLVSDEQFRKEFIDFSYMKVNKTIVAAHFGFKDIHSGFFYYYVPSFDNSYGKVGVGKMLLLKLVESYKDKGYKVFDFMRGSEVYKKNWMTDELQNFTIIGCKNNASLLVKGYVVLWSLAKTFRFIRSGY